MILVTGATGQFGSHAINHLLNKGIAASQIAALVRDAVGSSRVDLQACKLEYSIVSPK